MALRGVLHIVGVSKWHDARETLHDIDLVVGEGEIVSLLGPSGCGKSTLLRIAAGLDRNFSGRVMLDGRIVTQPSTDVGVIFQQPRLFPWLNVRRNIAFGLKGDDAEAVKWAKRVGLGDHLQSLPKELSGGMAQRCAIARALVTKPRIVLMDEPFSALDAFTRMHLHDLILGIKQEEKTAMLLVTHDIEEALYLSDRVVVMSERPGRVKFEFDVDLPRPRERRSVEMAWYAQRILDALDFGLSERGRKNESQRVAAAH